MKNIYILLLLLLSGCSYQEENQKAIEWIGKEKHPITVMYYIGYRIDFSRRYKLISADDKIFRTGFCSLDLPEEIK